MKTYLTRNGILVASKTQAGFFTNSGEFIRQASLSEARYLIDEIGVPEVHLNYVNLQREDVNFPLILFHFKGGEIPLPKWHFLFASEDVDDTDYHAGLACNGGAYRITNRNNYFVRLNGDKIEFATLTESFSSAEFHQTRNGSYQDANDCNYTHLIDVEGRWELSELQSQGREASLLQGYGDFCKLEHLFQPSIYTPSRYEDNTEPIERKITFAEYLRRWRLICAATGLSPCNLAGRRRRHPRR